MRYEIAKIDEVGFGRIVERNAHYAIVEFHDGGHRWQVIVDDDDYTIVSDINVGYKEIT